MIFAFYHLPCPAKVSYVRNPIGIEKSDVDGVLSISDIYFKLVSVMNKLKGVKYLPKLGLLALVGRGQAARPPGAVQ